MFNRILIPLDGSEFAKQALEPAFVLAEKFDAEVLLLRVAVPQPALVGLPSMAPRYYDLHGADRGRDHEEAEAYLYAIQLSGRGGGMPIHTQVISGTPPELIVAVAKEEAAELIVMSTHGRSGVSRLIYGSVAEAVLRGGRLPVLLTPIKA